LVFALAFALGALLDRALAALRDFVGILALRSAERATIGQFNLICFAGVADKCAGRPNT
jgi:hypothetical protein